MQAPPAPANRECMQPARDGTRLFVQTTEPSNGEARSARGTVLLTHGMGEHSGRYGHVVQRLAAAGFRIVNWDLRGHGRSGGPRGDAPDYATLIDDMARIWRLAQDGPEPFFLYGHSLGGQITLNFAVEQRPAVAGLVITSPWFELSFVPPSWKVFLANMTARVWPTFTQDTDVVPERLSRDLDFLKAMPDRQLMHHRMSARMFHALTEGAARAARDAAGLPYPILLVHGSDDPVTSPEATRRFFESLSSTDKSLLIIPDALHETHNDLGRDAVLDQITAWLKARAPLQQAL